MFRNLDMSKIQDLALWCSFLVSFFGLLRKGNAVPDSSKFEKSKILVRRNICLDLPGNIVYVYLGFSKTNQFGARDLVIHIPGNQDPALDPVRHLDALFSRVQIRDDAPVFSTGPNSFITYSTFTSRLKQILTKSGYNASLYSGHRFRRGGATFLHSCGGTAIMVQACGDWSSQCFTRYLHLSFAERLKSLVLIASHITATVI